VFLKDVDKVIAIRLSNFTGNFSYSYENKPSVYSRLRRFLTLDKDKFDSLAVSNIDIKIYVSGNVVN
jgi:hypothetical protein